MSETKTIKIQAYRDRDGKPTCSSSHAAQKSCRLLNSRTFGSVWVCGWTGEDLDYSFGFIRPHQLCPLWKDEA